MKMTVKGKQLDEERALYHLQDATVEDCIFAGPADGESALKESRRVTVQNCNFSLRYPLWHSAGFRLADSVLDGGTRAAVWYATDGEVAGCRIEGVKFLRECDRVSLQNCTVVSPECGWRCRDISMTDCTVTSEYFLFETRGGHLLDLRMRGKYSFQYTEDLTVDHAELDTKDAFWHSRHVTVTDSIIRGEYLGWYSEGLTLVRCHIAGTQPLCYCRDLRLVDCTMEGTDLSFEYSAVEADVRGHILSVKNPRAGHIRADSIGEIIMEDAVMETDCRIETGKK